MYVLSALVVFLVPFVFIIPYLAHHNKYQSTYSTYSVHQWGAMSPRPRVYAARVFWLASPPLSSLSFFGVYTSPGGDCLRGSSFSGSHILKKKFLMRAGKISFGLPLPRCTRPGCCLVRSCPGFVPVSKRGSPGIVCKFRQYSAFRFGASWRVMARGVPPALSDRHIISARRVPSVSEKRHTKIALFPFL